MNLLKVNQGEKEVGGEDPKKNECRIQQIMSTKLLLCLLENGEISQKALKSSMPQETLGVDIDTVCGGRALCGRCQVEFIEGEFAKHGISSKHSNISSRSEAEKKFATRKNLGSERRLSCQSKLLGDIVVDVPQESQLHQQTCQKRV